jgi:hypothetical protein
MPRTTRLHLIGALVALVALIAVPVALGAKPTKTVVTAEGFFIPAGFGCSFDVEEQVAEGTTFTVTEFTDGRTVTHGNSNPVLVNLETGDSFQQKTRAKVTETVDPATNELLVQISGRVFINLFPGDQGPFGEVQAPGAVLSVIGHQVFTVDLDTEVVTSYSLDGRVVADICAELSD